MSNYNFPLKPPLEKKYHCVNNVKITPLYFLMGYIVLYINEFVLFFT